MSGVKEDDMSGIKATVKKFEEIMSTKGVAGLRDELSSNLHAWQNTKLNIAVVGNAGSGKSTFINAVLGENAAPAGIVETTMSISSYTGKNKNVIFWDVPGVGTPTFSKKDYADMVDFHRFDYVILIARSRFTAIDVWLSRKIKEVGKKFCFVRTHIDEDIENDHLSHPTSHDAQKFIEDIRKDCSENLKGVAPVDIYLIDSYECDKYDFDELIRKLFLEVGGIKAYLLATSLVSATQSIIDAKAKLLHETIFIVALNCALNHTKETADTVAKNALQTEGNRYRETFEIDRETLMRDRDLFSLSEMASNYKIHQLEEMSKGMLEVTEKGLKMYHEKIETLKTCKILPFDKIGYCMIIQTLLEGLLEGYHRFASHIFQNMPLEVAQKCFDTDWQKETEEGH